MMMFRRLMLSDQQNDLRAVKTDGLTTKAWHTNVAKSLWQF